MTVYVDDFNARFGRMIMCHLTADTREELLTFAMLIGLRPEWQQCWDAYMRLQERASGWWFG